MLTVLAVILALLAAAPAASPREEARLSPAEIDAAIEWGRTAGDAELAQYVLKTSDTWTVEYDTPRLRVAQLAARLKKTGKALNPAEIPPGLVRNEVHVYALARLQRGITGKVPNIAHVTLRQKDALSMEQPRWVTRNLNRARAPEDPGVAQIARSVTAGFALSAFRPGAELRVAFEDGSRETLPIESMLPRLRR